jgi:pimeloyl-ACP methyl ester carboxylesterase
MEKLFLLPLLFSFMFSFGQNAEDLSEGDLIVSGPVEHVQPENFIVKRAALKTGVQLEYVEKGNPKGVPVIFLHGITDSWHSFETNLPYLPAEIHALALSQRGHGGSDKPLGGYTPKHFAADVAAFVEQQKLGPVVIVGHSMGGVNAQRFAIDYPQLTKALVIIDSDPLLIENEGMPEFFEAVMKLNGPVSREFMVEFQKSTITKQIDSSYFEIIVNEGLKVPTAVFQAACKGMLEDNLAEEIKTIRKPALIFWGEEDAVCQRKGQERLRKNISNVHWIEYKGTGHALHWEEPQRFVKDLVQFINSLEKN